MLDTKKVLVGLPDQSTTGAVRRGPVLDSIPATLSDVLTAITNFSASGYVSEEGVTLAIEISTTDVREWGGAIVRKLLESFDGKVSFTLLQSDEEGWKQALGESNVTKVAATTTHGEQLKISIGAHLAEPNAWAFLLKDGAARAVVLIPNGQAVSGMEITFVAGEPIKLPLEISCNDDGTGTGNCIYIYTDDGVISA